MNTTATKTLTITSSGDAPLTVKSVTVSGAGFAISRASFPATLNSGQSLTIQVSFLPATASAASGTIAITTNSSNNGTMMVALTGNGTATPNPQLTVSATSLDFGSVTVNSTSLRTLTLTSSGKGTLSVNSVAITGSGFAISGASFPATLDSGQTATLQVSFDPTVAGTASGNITISSNSGRGSVTTVPLGGTGEQIATPKLTLSAASIDFGRVSLNTNSRRALTLTSSGGAALTVNSVTLAGSGFATSGARFPMTLNPGQSVTVQVSFDPADPGAATGTLTVSSNSSAGNSATVSLSGTGTASATPQLTVSPSALAFGNVVLNTASTKMLTLTSSGTAALTVNSVTVAGSGFSISRARFPRTLNPGQSLTLQVSFDPTVTGSAAGTITISSNSSSGSSTTVALRGLGTASPTPELTVSASTISFGTVTVNTTSTQRLTLTSSGTAALTVNSVRVAGSGFAISGATFPATLNPNQSLTIQVSFHPTVPGTVMGTVTISSNSGTGSSTAVALSGTGTAAATPNLTLSANSLSFGNVTLNTTSAKTLTLTSSGTAALTVNSVSVAGSGFSISRATFPTTLNPGQWVTLQVNFDPTVTGSATGTISISSNSSTGSPATVSLSGMGTAPATPQLTVSPPALSFGSVVVNTASTKMLTLTSSGNAALRVNSVSIAGSGFSISRATFPTTLNPGQSVTLQVSFDPTVTGSATGTISISSNSSTGNSTAVTLSGTGTAAATPNLTISANTLSFGNVMVNTAATKTLTLTSSGAASLTVNSVVETGSGFAISGVTFPTTLNPGQSLALQVSFNPTIRGSATGTITISSNSSSGATTTVALTGTGTASQLSLSATSLDFGNTNLNTTSTKPLTLTSSGNAPLTVNSATVKGSSFTISGGTFPALLNPGQSIALQVSFDPTVAGATTGSISISSNSSTGTTTTVALSGTGIANPILTLSSTSLNFGDDPLNTPVNLPLTLTSTGTSPVTISTATIAGAGFTFSGATFPVTLNPNIAITIRVQFDPTTAGAAAGSLTFTTNSSTGNVRTVSLAGNGTSTQHRVSLTWSAPVNSPVPVTGYNIYRATASSSSFSLLNSSSTTTYVDLQVSSSTSYSYYVTSVDGAGTESTPSNQVTVTVP